MQMSLIDWICLWLELYSPARTNAVTADAKSRSLMIPLGTFMPYFYGDFSRTYAIIPGFYETRGKDPKRASRRCSRISISS